MIRPILWKAAEALGMPEWLTDSQNRFYDQLKRMFKYGRALGPMHRTWVSVLQGCAMSQIWANIDGSAWAWEVESKAN